MGLEIEDGEILPANLVIAGIGVIPNTELADNAGLEVDNGIKIDHCGRTSSLNIYAAGDCASFVHPRYDGTIRLESVQNATDQSTGAVKAMCGETVHYDALPWFWSEQYDVRLQMAGLANGHDETVVRGDPDNDRKFSIFYFKSGVLVAVDAVNSPAEFMFGKKIIIEALQTDREKLCDPQTPIKEVIVG